MYQRLNERIVPTIFYGILFTVIKSLRAEPLSTLLSRPLVSGCAERARSTRAARKPHEYMGEQVLALL